MKERWRDFSMCNISRFCWTCFIFNLLRDVLCCRFVFFLFVSLCVVTVFYFVGVEFVSFRFVSFRFALILVVVMNQRKKKLINDDY